MLAPTKEELSLLKETWRRLMHNSKWHNLLDAGVYIPDKQETHLRSQQSKDRSKLYLASEFEDAITADSDFWYDFDHRVYRTKSGRALPASELVRVTEFFEARIKLEAEKRPDNPTQAELQKWEEDAQDLSKLSTTLMVSLAVGGWDAMNQKSWGTVGGLLKKEYKTISDVRMAVERGQLPPSQLDYASQVIVRQSYITYSAVDRKLMIDNHIYLEEARATDANPCDDCMRYAAAGWRPIGSFPNIGQLSRCRWNCRCLFLYR